MLVRVNLNLARTTISKHLASTTAPSSSASALTASWIAPTDTSSLRSIFKLRYDVMVRETKNSPFDQNHHCVFGDEFRDDADLYDSTGHLLVRVGGAAVASVRIVNGNHEKLEAESANWHDHRSSLSAHGVVDTTNIAEAGRLVCSRAVRGTSVTPLMYLHCLDWYLKNNVPTLTGIANTEARPLIDHYKKWTKVKRVTEEPFAADSFIPGRKLDLWHLNVGLEGSKERDSFTVRNLVPAFVACGMMKNPG